MPDKIKALEIKVDRQLRELLAQAYAALRHASGRYDKGEPILTENAIRRECYRAYQAIERAGIPAAPCNHNAHNWNLQENGTWICQGCGEVLEK